MVGGVHVRRALIVPRGKGKTIDLAMNYFSFIASASLSALRVHHGDYDVVFVYQLSPVTMAIPGIVAATKAHVPLVTYVVDLWPESLSAAGGTEKSEGSIPCRKACRLDLPEECASLSGIFGIY